ncbi:MAG: hypothetical protein LBR61_11235 [Synergistaceae bacterium]|nr:hypothetical protein [Synergistaceae bacterium]
MIQYAWRDFHLDVALLGLETGLPEIVLENLEFEREISGDLWRVRVPFARRSDGVVSASSIDILRQMPDGREWYFKSGRGVFREASRKAELYSLLGTLEGGTRVWNLESPFLSWSEGTNEFLFSGGFTIYDAEFILKADTASIDSSGIVLLDRGGTIRWTQNGK